MTTTVILAGGGSAAGIVVAAVVAWLFVGWLVGAYFGDRNGRLNATMWIAVVLGPTGWIMAALMPRTPAAEALWRHEVEHASAALQEAQAERGGAGRTQSEE